MATQAKPTAAAKLDIRVRPLRESDLPVADHIMRLALGTFLGLPEPTSFMGDAAYVRARWHADPDAAFGAVRAQPEARRSLPEVRLLAAIPHRHHVEAGRTDRAIGAVEVDEVL